MSMLINPYFLIALSVIIGIAFMIIKILREYERGVIFFLGRFQMVKGPGPVAPEEPVGTE